MFDRAIVPLDGSPFAAAALPWIERLPVRSALLLRIEEDLPYDIAAAAGIDSETVRDAEAAADRTALEAEAAPIREAGIPVGTAVRFSPDVAGAIIDEAAPQDIIVMATHGRGSAGRLLHGSIADRVARHSPVPVLLARPEAHSERPGRIVVPIDGSPVAESALTVAATIARDRRLPLRLVRVVDLSDVLREARRERPLVTMPVQDSSYDDARSSVAATAERHLAALAAPLRAEGLDVSVQVESGTPAQALLNLLRPSDLVVMTSHGRGGVQRWLIGSVAVKLVRESPAPVLLVRPS
ncbi:MAG: universal stress protein [Thermomicrobiales bacterium]